MKQDSYGYKINKSIQEKANNSYELKETTLYSAFRQLEQSAYQKYLEDWEQAKEIINKLVKIGE